MHVLEIIDAPETISTLHQTAKLATEWANGKHETPVTPGFEEWLKQR